MTQKSPMKKLCFDGILSSGLTGKGVRVALVDSGINPRHPHVKKISGGVHIEIDNHNTILRSNVDIADEIGHGTACAGVVRYVAGDCNLYSVKVFGKTPSTYVLVLIEAIEWSIENDMSIINLSLGVKDKKHLRKLRDVCEKACKKGIIIIAAGKRLGEGDYLTSFPNLIVTTSIECNPGEYHYDEASPIKFLASAYPRPLPGVPVKQNFHGESFSAAWYSGLTALIKERYPLLDTDEIKMLLTSGSDYC